MTLDIRNKRSGTAAEWTAGNRTLGDGETGVETDTGKTKTGDGVSAWADLEYDPGTGGGGASGAEPIKIALFGNAHNFQVVRVTGPVPAEGGYWRNLAMAPDTCGIGQVAKIAIHNGSDVDIEMNDAWVQITNMDGTQSIEREAGTVTIPAGADVDLTLNFQNVHVGTDLSWDAGSLSIMSAAGGVFAMSAAILIQPVA